MPSDNENFEYIQLRITESFSRALETWTDENSKLSLEARNGHYIFVFKNADEPEKYFKAADDHLVIDYYPLACCRNNGDWNHVGAICSKLRMTANDETFDQVRQSLVKVDQDSRKTNFPSWDSVGEPKVKQNVRKSSRMKASGLRTTIFESKRTSKGDISAPKVITNPRKMAPSLPPQSPSSKKAQLSKKSLQLVTSATQRRQILERRLATIYNDAALSLPERSLQIDEVKSDLFVLVDELLACKELATYIPPSADAKISKPN